MVVTRLFGSISMLPEGLFCFFRYKLFLTTEKERRRVMDQNFFQKTPKQTLEHLQVTSDGLTSAQATQRLAQYGHNQLAEGKKKSVLAVFAEQFKDRWWLF